MALTSKSERVLDFGMPKSQVQSKIMRVPQGNNADGEGIIVKRVEYKPAEIMPAHKEYIIDPAKAPFNSSTVRDVNAIPP